MLVFNKVSQGKKDKINEIINEMKKINTKEVIKLMNL